MPLKNVNACEHALKNCWVRYRENWKGQAICDINFVGFTFHETLAFINFQLHAHLKAMSPYRSWGNMQQIAFEASMRAVKKCFPEGCKLNNFTECYTFKDMAENLKERVGLEQNVVLIYYLNHCSFK